MGQFIRDIRRASRQLQWYTKCAVLQIFRGFLAVAGGALTDDEMDALFASGVLGTEVWRTVAAMVLCNPEGRLPLANEDARGVLVELGRRAASEAGREAVAKAIAQISVVKKGQMVLSTVGQRAMATQDVREVLVGMGAACGCDEVRQAVLACLARRPGRIYSRSEIEERLQAGGVAEASSNSLEVIVSRLRKKLGNAAISTHRGLGYRLDG